MVSFLIVTGIWIRGRKWLFALLWLAGLTVFLLLLLSHNRGAVIAVVMGISVGILLLPGRKLTGIFALALLMATSALVITAMFPRAAALYYYYFTGDASVVASHFQPEVGELETYTDFAASIQEYKDADIKESDQLRLVYLKEVWEQLKERPLGFGPSKLVIGDKVGEPHSMITYFLYAMGYAAIPWMLAMAAFGIARLITAHRQLGADGFASIVIPACALVSWLAFGVMHDAIYFGVFWTILGLFVAPRDEENMA